MNWTEGNTVAGHRLVERLGQGHFGEVWKAVYQGDLVALKLFARPYRVSTIRREALAQYALGQLPIPAGRFFPTVDHIDVANDPPYMRMELIEGVPLEEILGQPTLSLSERFAFGEQILTALSHVHEQEFVHGDLSPMNIMVTGHGSDGGGSIQLHHRQRTGRRSGRGESTMFRGCTTAAGRR